MTKRTLAALAALLAFMAVLVAVPLATSETAEAHTKTVKRCSYDPFAGSQCWYETVAHTHRVIPDNPPPDTSPKPKKCPAGTTGTPPDCLPIPPDNTNHVPTTTTAPPTTTTTEPPRCPAGYSGTPPNCITDVCPSGYSGTPPNCVKDVCPAGWTGTPPDCRIIQTVCPDGYSGTPPNCVKDVCPDGETGTPPNCKTVTVDPPPCETTQRTGQKPRERHRHTLVQNRSSADSGCHYVSASHCPSGRHEHGHGTGQCHSNPGSRLYSSVRSNRHAGDSQHCAAAGHHEHEHGSGDCHHADTIHCPAGQHAHPEVVNGATLHERCHAEKPTDHHCGGDSGLNTGRHKHDGLGCHPAGVDNCPTGQHEHTGDVFLNVYGCHALGIEHPDYFTKGHEYVLSGTGEIVCFFAGGAANKAAKLVSKGPKWLKDLLGDNVGTGAGVGCETLFDKAIEEEKKRAAEDKKEHDEDAQDKVDKDDSGTDSGDGSDDDSGDSTDGDGSEAEDEDPEPTPGICDRDTSPTNPYKIGPSNTTPQQWADWWAWFDCP